MLKTLAPMQKKTMTRWTYLLLATVLLLLGQRSNAQKKGNNNYDDPIYDKVEYKKQDSVHLIYFEIAKGQKRDILKLIL